MQDKFKQHGIQSVSCFRAIDGETSRIPAGWTGTSGAYGCLLSHLEVVREARRLGLPSVLIFEDDVVFDDQFEKKFGDYFRQLPADWDMLFFGALHKDELIKVSDNVGRITQSNSTYACALKETVYDAFIEVNSKSNEVLDVNSLVLQKQYNCYCFLPHLAWVEAEYSDAQQKLVHHWYLRESLVLFGPQVDRILSETTLVFAHNAETPRAAENLRCLVEYYDHFFSPYIEMVIVEQGCFAAGMKQSDRNYFILSDSNIYLETLDIRANLRMLEQYDRVTGFSHIIDLTPEASERLRATKSIRGLQITGNRSVNNGHYQFLTRRGINNQQARVFKSPNAALRLHD